MATRAVPADTASHPRQGSSQGDRHGDALRARGANDRRALWSIRRLLPGLDPL